MGRIDQELQPGETIGYTIKLSKFIYLRLLIFFAMAGFFVWLSSLMPDQFLTSVLILLALLLGFSSILGWVAICIYLRIASVVVTNRRLISIGGLMSRSVAEFWLDRIDSIVVQQSILGRLFNYGDVIIQGNWIIRYVHAPTAMRDHIVAARQP